MCQRSCLPGVYLAVGKLADIPFRDVNFLRYFGCSNICFLDCLISLVNFRLTWRIVAPTRRKIARKLGDISKRIEREIRSHYFCNTSHKHEHYKFLRLDPQYFLRLLAACGNISNFLRVLAARFSTSCVLNVLAGKLQKPSTFTSCAGLRVLAAQELLAPLLARALFLGCTHSRPQSYAAFFKLRLL